MNDFIVLQATPDMLSSMPYETYILFGLLTYVGAAFVWYFVPETRRLTLEETDIRYLDIRGHGTGGSGEAAGGQG